jgi:hypothetical protein
MAAYKGDAPASQALLFDAAPFGGPTAGVDTRTGRPLSKRTLETKRLEGRRVLSMQQRHGRGAEGVTCRDCVHLVHVGHRGYLKCELYGISQSEASDWRAKWPACGAFTAPPAVEGVSAPTNRSRRRRLTRSRSQT